MVTYLRYPPFPLPQGGVRQLDDEVWALFSNFSNGRAGSPPFFPSSSKTSFSSSSSSSRTPTSSSSSRWSLRNLSPPPPPSDISSSVRPTRPQPYSPGHAPHLQVHSVRDCKEVHMLFVCLFVCFLVIVVTSCVSLWGQHKNTLSKTSSSASGRGGKVDSGMTDWFNNEALKVN